MNWYREIGRLIDALEQPDFPDLLIQNLQDIVTCDLAAIFVNRGRARPLLVYDNFQNETSKRALATYLDHTYVLNPFYNAHLQGIEEGVHRIRDVAPDGFFDSELSRSADVTPSTSEEIGFITRGWPKEMEEAGLVIRLGDLVTAEVALYRAKSLGGLDEGQLNRLRQVSPAVAACFRRYWGLQGKGLDQGKDAASSWADRAFDSFGDDCLTPREQEVIRLVLRGHSSQSIGYNLGISLTTVKSHRKNAYEKLGIATQAELLSLFLKSMRDHAGTTRPA